MQPRTPEGNLDSGWAVFSAGTTGALPGCTPRHVTEDRGSKASKAGLILSTGLILSPGPHGHHGGALARKAPVWRATLPTLLCVVLRAPLLSIEILRAAKGQLRSRTDALPLTPRGSAETPGLQGAVLDAPTVEQHGPLLGPALGTAWGIQVSAAEPGAGAGPPSLDLSRATPRIMAQRVPASGTVQKQDAAAGDFPGGPVLPPRHAHGDLTSLAPHERLPEILVAQSLSGSPKHQV